MPDNKVTRQVKLVTEQHIIDKDSGQEGYPMREWQIQIFLVNSAGEEMAANVFGQATYNLHPSFPKPVHAIKKPPFLLKQEGWGEFDMEIVLQGIDRGGDHTIHHDLNFREERYETLHPVTFKNPRPALAAALAESGAMENGIKKKDESAKKKKRVDKGVDMEKLADNLQRLGEDDLLQVVQMVHDNKTADTYTKNDVEQGEFHVDLYTLPDHLVRMLWDFSQERL